jgi:hypothetical protein
MIDGFQGLDPQCPTGFFFISTTFPIPVRWRWTANVSYMVSKVVGEGEN